MKNYYVLLIVILLLGLTIFSCSESDIIEDIRIEENVNRKYRIRPFMAGDGKFDVIGFGYDITGGYLKNESVRYPVINMEKLEKEQNGRIIYS